MCRGLRTPPLPGTHASVGDCWQNSKCCHLLIRGATQFPRHPRVAPDPETEYVSFDRPRVLRVLGRIIADLDGLTGLPPVAEEDVNKGGVEARRARHRRRLAEPDPPPKQLTVREDRAALRALLKLPPSEKG